VSVDKCQQLVFLTVGIRGCLIGRSIYVWSRNNVPPFTNEGDNALCRFLRVHSKNPSLDAVEVSFGNLALDIHSAHCQRFSGISNTIDPALLAKAPRGRDEYIERIVKTFKVVGSPAYPMDEARFRELAGRLYDRSHNPKGVLRQMHAISASGDRTAALRKLKLPATVIHGTRDPLVRPSGGRATARAIPGARLRIVEGMGHDLPRALWPTFAGEIADTASRAGWRAPAAQPA